ncbi:MAG: hypothetical protein V4722_20790 [Bacteroidota bacterium]
MNDELSKREKNYVLMRSIRDYGMGILLLGLGLCFFFSKQVFGRAFFEKDEQWMRWTMLAIFTLYGGFRIWRGYVKQYFRRDE